MELQCESDCVTGRRGRSASSPGPAPVLFSNQLDGAKLGPTHDKKRPARSHQSPPLPPGRAVAAVLETRTSPSKQGRPAVPVHLAPSCSPLPALWAHLTPAGKPGPSALYQTSRHQGLTRLLQARGALRVGSVIMARPHIVEHKGASGPIGTRLSLSLSGRERAPRSPHGRHACGPHVHQLSIFTSQRRKTTMTSRK